MKATIKGCATIVEYGIDEIIHIKDSVIRNGGVSPIIIGETLAQLMANFNDVDFNTPEGRVCASFIVKQMMKADEPLPKLEPGTISIKDA